MYSNKQIIVFIILFFSGFAFGQNSKKELDSIFTNDVKTLFAKGELKESLALCKKLIKDYEKINEEKSVIKLYIYAANVNSNLFEIKESLQYLDIALKKNADLNDPNLDAKIYAELGRNYNFLGFTKKALESYDKSLNIASSLPLRNKRSLLDYTYGLRSMIYEDKKNIPALYRDLILAHKSFPSTYNSSRLAKYFTVYQKNLDSARYYLDLGKKLYKEGVTPIYQYSILQRNSGRYYSELKDYKKAISALEESLAISIKLNKPQDVKDTRKLLYEVYKASRNTEKAIENIEIYTKISDSLINKNAEAHEIPVNHVIVEKERVNQQSKSKLYFIIFVIILLFTALLIAVLKKYNSKKKESDYLINTKSDENLQLQQKVNDAFEEVVQLAKNNSPEFFTRFKEVYPDFIDKLLEIDSKLRVSELTLLAYSYLGFNAKDIALYTFKSVNTVRSRKYNLRKKLGISPEESMELWLKNLV
jgi:tetratricopeptide (TPR) repeat protein